MPIHFERDELAMRRATVCTDLSRAGLDGLLMFRQESMYYLTGYDSFGYVFFQCLYLGGDGTLLLLTRSPDLRQAQQTSIIEDIRIWVDGPDADPATQLREILRGAGCAGKTLGVEYEAYGLTAANGRRLETAFDGFCTLKDASLLVTRRRAVKSPAEVAYVRRAGELADAAYEAAIESTGPGAFEGDILAAMQGAVFRGGGDYPGNEFIIGSGPRALLCRYFTGRRHLDGDDQLTLEWSGAFRHYHAAMMRTIRVGKPPEHQARMYEASQAALLAVEAALHPGKTFGEAFDAHADTLDRAGFAEHRLNACGYSLGATFSPNWMDWPMLYRGNPVPIEPGMVVFVHIIVFDSERGLAASVGRTSLITGSGPESLSRAPLDLAIR